MKTSPLFLLAFSALSLPLRADDAPAPRLNVLHIIADDLNEDLGCYGHPIVKSPNIDRLAARGMRFDRAYCNYPVCNPSRTSFLSGKRPDTTGIVDNATPTRTYLKDSVMLPQFFRQHGWRTEKVGKIFHTGDRFEDPPSWDFDLRETNEAKQPPEQQVVRKVKGGGVVLDAADADTWDGKVARKSVELLEAAARGGKPFYIAAGFRRPHTPYIAPRKYHELYPPAQMAWPAEPPGHLAGIPPIALTYPPGEPTLPEARRAEVMSAYFASTSFMDAQVGVLLDALDRLKLWETTVVVFQSDHGYHLGEHGGLHHKMTLFEEGVRVPLIVAAPGITPGAVSPRLVELVDLYPTLADLCGLKPPADLEGISFRPLLDDPGRPWKAAAFAVVGRRDRPDKGGNNEKLDIHFMGRTVRTERWRYTEWPDGTAELYDQEADPREYANLAGRPEHTATRAGLRALLKAGWREALPTSP
jgi:iduronate 2-sulfatase